MAYQINNFNGTFLVSVQDGTVDTSTDLTFVGKNYAGYGAIENENFLYLLQNFANTSAPPKKLSGQIWYDSGTKRLRYWDGTQFKVAGGAEVGSTAPSGMSIGDFWFDTSSLQLKTWNGTGFTLIGPQASPTLGQSAVVPIVVKDDQANNQSILKFLAGGNVVAVVSDVTFTLDSLTNPISNFSYIKRGLTIADTGLDGNTADDHRFWGTASNADKLGGVPAANYLQTGNVVFSQEISFKNPGFQVGDNNDFRFRIENGYEIVGESRLGNPVIIRMSVSPTDIRDVAVFDPTGIVPGDTNTYSLGSVGNVWSNVYATRFTGAVTGAVTGNVTGDLTGSIYSSDSTLLINKTSKQIGYSGANLIGNLTGSVTGNVNGTASNASSLNAILPSTAIPGGADATSIPVRDSTGNLYATNFIGTSTFANRMLINNAASDTDPNYKSAKTTATGNTIAARDSAGNLLAVLFQGTATTARYADLAEKYLADKEYDAGTVVMVGGEAEVTESQIGFKVIGVVSTNPAYMMNSELKGGTYIALKGRVPVKVLGPVAKGDRLVGGENGTAFSLGPHGNHIGGVFAIALESSSNIETKLIEAVVL
jgi:hypothetical protein